MRNVISSSLIILTSALVVISSRIGMSLPIRIGLIALIVLLVIDILRRIINGRKEKANSHIDGSQSEI